MKYVPLGRTGILVSELTLGTATFGGAPPLGGVTVEQARGLVNLALDAGVNALDTANNYGAGEAESILGTVLEGRRDEIILTTKVGLNSGPGPNDRGLSRKHIISQCETSLRRLKTDYIDVYLMHSWDFLTDLDESLGAMTSLVESGKVRSIGCSNFSASQLTETSLTLGSLLACQQIYYSLVHREAEVELMPVAERRGVANTIWSPLAQGLLSGKYRRDAPWPSDGRQNSEWNQPPVDDWEHVFDIIEVVVAVSEEISATPSEVALAFVLQRSDVSTVLLGAKNLEQLRANLTVVDLTLPADAVHRLEEVSVAPLPYPHWHQQMHSVRLP